MMELCVLLSTLNITLTRFSYRPLAFSEGTKIVSQA